MDAFFVSVELLDRPELRGQPVIVGGQGPRGVVAAASYEARAYGVHSAMASVTARRLCPQAVFLDGRMHRYKEVSQIVMGVFRSITPLVEPLSLDEAFLDVSGRTRALGDGATIAQTIRAQVAEEAGLTCSVGVAPNKFLAKLASERAKPKATPDGPVFRSGVAVVDPDRIFEFLDPLPVQALWGVGPATLTKLQRLGVVTVSDLRSVPEGALRSALGKSLALHLGALSHGRDDRSVVADSEMKSISHEETFVADLFDREEMVGALVRLADAVGERVRAQDVLARTVQLKVRTSDFRSLTRSFTPPEPTRDGNTIAQIAIGLLDGLLSHPEASNQSVPQRSLDIGVRLLGVGVTNFVPPGTASHQLSLIDEVSTSGNDLRGPRRSDAEVQQSEALVDTVDEIRKRFGRSVIGSGRLIGANTRGVLQPGAQQWGPTANPRTTEPTDSSRGQTSDDSERSATQSPVD
jgi:DNA polymerase-4